MPDDPDVRRLWTIAVVANSYHVLPSVVARDLDNDPEQLSLVCLTLLNYADAKRAFERGNEHELASWKDSPMMGHVEKNTFDLHQERLEQRKAEADG